MHHLEHRARLNTLVKAGLDPAEAQILLSLGFEGTKAPVDLRDLA